ncbi:Il26 [Columba guinea]|nr:Il26 [Columba guinea]
MKVYSIFSSGRFLVLLCLFAAEGKKLPTGKHTCRKGLLYQVTENLYIKATSLKSSIPKDLIKNTRLLKKTTKMLFMNELVGSGQDAGDTMETSHFPAGDVALCCSFSTKAATRQGKSRRSWFPAAPFKYCGWFLFQHLYLPDSLERRESTRPSMSWIFSFPGFRPTYKPSYKEQGSDRQHTASVLRTDPYPNGPKINQELDIQVACQ